jgi:HK97 family phage prohead protease
MTMQFERRDIPNTPELRFDEERTRIIGYAAVFNRYSLDLGGFVEQIHPGAFGRVLGRDDNVLALFNHSMDNLLATRNAGSLRLSEDDTGLRYEFDLDTDDPDHQRVIAKVRRGDLTGSSFGFRVASDDWSTTEDDYPLRTVTEVAQLRDVGPVTTPAYPDTATVAPLALRSLAELAERTVDELVAAESLRDFLLNLREDETETETSGETLASVTAITDAQRLRLALAEREARLKKGAIQNG